MRDRVMVVSRALVALLGTLPVAVLLGIACACWLPAREDLRIAIGLLVTFPVWVLAMLAAYLDARVWRAALALALSTLVLAISIEAFAQDAPAEDDIEDDELLTDDVVVSALSEAEELAQSAESVQVIELEEVRAQTIDLGEVIARVAGNSVRRASGLGSEMRVCVQGMCGRSIPEYLDGVPLELTGWGHGLTSVPINMLERVEIYRGLVPVRLGTDALGGVINLVRRADYYRPHVFGSLQTGSFGTYRGFVQGGMRHDDTGLFALASAWYDHADNDYWIDVEVPDSRGRLSPARVRRFHDGYQSLGAALETGVAGVSWADRLTLRAFVAQSDREIQNNLVMTVPYGEAAYGELSSGGLLRYQHAISDEVEVDAFVGYTRRDLHFSDASQWVYDWYGRRVRERRVGGEIDSPPRDQMLWDDAIPARLNVRWAFAPGHSVHLGITPELLRRIGDERIESNPGGRDPLTARRDLFTMISGLEYELSAFDGVLENVVFLKDYVYYSASEEVLPGFLFVARQRSAHDVGFGEAVRVRIGDWLLLRGTYELATRLPEPYEVFGDGVQIAPNLELDPERSHNGTFEVVFDLRDTPIGLFDASLAGFVRWRQNMIVLLGDDRTLTHQNVYEALTAGVEANLSWTSPGDWVLLGANATYVDDRNTSTDGTFADFAGDRIPNNPYFFANLSARFRASSLVARDELTLLWSGRYVHEFFRGWESQGRRDLKQTIPSQLSQDLTLTYTVLGPPRISTTLEVTNLTDAALYDFIGVQRPGRAVFVKLTFEH